MKKRPGQISGQPAAPLGPDAAPPSGWGWREYLAALVEAHGTLTAVAWKLIERGEGPDDVASVERALRRLRERGGREGGLWGQRVLRRFGVPRAIEDRLRWMGLYHSPFNDLPIALCEDQLRLWDQPPVSVSRARVWLELAAASLALRKRAFDDARIKLAAAAKTLSLPDPQATSPADARVEIALARAYLESRSGTPDQVPGYLQQAEHALDAAGGAVTTSDRACFQARLVDQQAFRCNQAGDYAAALALYRTLPAADVHPFASYRREAGLAFGCLQLGDRLQARQHALAACEHAGDGGYTRLRVMALLMLARVEGAPTAATLLARAEAIATRLGDKELQLRISRAQARARGQFGAGN
jgi:hypothetical protein